MHLDKIFWSQNHSWQLIITSHYKHAYNSMPTNICEVMNPKKQKALIMFCYRTMTEYVIIIKVLSFAIVKNIQLFIYWNTGFHMSTMLL